MMEYFYHKYPYSNDCALHARLFAIAVKYKVMGLRTMAGGRFNHCMEGGIDNDSFPIAVKVIYKLAPDDTLQLRDLVAKAMAREFHEFKRFDNSAELEKVLKKIPAFAYQVLQHSHVACEMSEHGYRHGLYTMVCGACDRSASACYTCSHAQNPLCPACGGSVHRIA